MPAYSEGLNVEPECGLSEGEEKTVVFADMITVRLPRLAIFPPVTYHTSCAGPTGINRTTASLRRSHDDMDATVRAHDVADLSHFERKRGFLEQLLHLTARKQAEIAVLVVRGTIRMHLGELAKLVRLVWRIINLCLVLPQSRHCLVL